LAIQNPIAGIGANLALGGTGLLQAEHRFLSLAQEKAGSIISAALAKGPTLICLGSKVDDN
jgi:predicted polyphosphate/ATP-dependent NAD kinase